MQHFIFGLQSEKVSRTYGGSQVVVSVYQIKRGVPVFVGSVEWCTRAYRGAASEVMVSLAYKGLIPKRFRNAYYQSTHFGPVKGQPFTIHGIGAVG